MLSWLARRVGIYRDERGPFALAALTICAIDLCEAFTTNCADALYLSRRGPRGLGLQLALSSVLLAGTLGVVGALADRGERARLLGRLAAIGAIALLLARGALVVFPAQAPAALLVLSKQLSAALDLGFWVLIADRFDARQNRRLVPLLMASGGAGLVLGSLATRAIVQVISVEDLLLCGLFACGLTLIGARTLVPRGRQAIRLDLGPPARSRLGLSSLREGLDATRRSELARWLVMVVAVAGAFGPILYTALGATASARYPHEADLAAFYGRFRGITSLASLLAQAFVAPGLLRMIGVGWAFVISPIVAVLAGGALILRADLPVAALAQAATRVLDAAVQTPAEKLAQNLMRRDVRGRVGAFLDGIAKRAGALVGGVLVTGAVLLPRALGIVTATVGATWLLAAVVLRRRYPALAILELAARRPQEGEPSVVLDEATVRVLARDLAAEDDAKRELAIEVLGHGPPERAATLFLTAARAAPLARGRLVAALDGILELDPVARRSKAVQAGELLLLLDEAAAAPPLERANIVQAFGRLADEVTFDAARPRLASLARGEGSPAVRLAAGAALARTNRGEARRASPDEGRSPIHDQLVVDALIDEALAASPAARDAAALALIGALRGSSQPEAPPEEETYALRVIALEELRAEALAMAAGRGLLREFPIQALTRIAASAEDDERVQAFRALGETVARARRHGNAIPWRETLLEVAREALDDPRLTVSLRAGALAALGALGDAPLAPLLAASLADPHDPIREAAAAGLATIGIAALPVLLVAARFGRRGARVLALEVLRDLRALPSAFDDLIQSELDELGVLTLRLHAFVHGRGLESGGAQKLLVARLEERLREIARTLLLVVEVRLGDRNVGAAARRFLLATDARARARALETLDALLPRAIALRVIPALDDAPLDERALRAASALEVALPGVDEATRAELGGADGLTRTLIVHAVGKSGRRTHKEAIRAAARAGAVDLDPLRLLRRIQDMVTEEDREEADVPSSVETMIALREVPLFAELTPSQLALLAEHAAWETYAGESAITGDDGDGAALYVVVSGRVRLGEPPSAHEIGAGAVFGQRAFLGGDPVMPRATAVDKTRVLRLGRQELERVVEDAPGIALALVRVLARLM